MVESFDAAPPPRLPGEVELVEINRGPGKIGKEEDEEGEERGG